MKRLIALALFFGLLTPLGLSAHEGEEGETIETEGQVVEIVEENLVADQAYQVTEVRVTEPGNAFEGQTFTVDSRESMLEGVRYVVRPGDRVKLAILDRGEDGTDVFITDMIRLPGLWTLLGLFAIVILIVGRKQGAASLLGLAGTLLVLFGFILPQLLSGRSPTLVTLIGASAILMIAIFGSHGFRREAGFAFAATVAGISLTSLLAAVFTRVAHLTGLGTEDAAFLQLSTDLPIDFHGLMLAGMILGAVGVLDDVAVSQTETVYELKRINPGLSRRELSSRALRLGRHHIASVVNTLVLVYASAALPLLMLFQASGHSASELLNAEFLAEEIVRTLVGTIGLVLTVPIATWLSAWDASKKHAKRESI